MEPVLTVSPPWSARTGLRCMRLGQGTVALHLDSCHVTDQLILGRGLCKVKENFKKWVQYMELAT